MLVKYRKGIRKERRGGDRVQIGQVKEMELMRKFIGNCKGSEKQYNRRKLIICVYLNSEMTITKLWKVHNDTVDIQLKSSRSVFQKHFCNEFKVGCRNPHLTYAICAHALFSK